MFKHRCAYAIARGDETEEACVTIYEDAVRRVRINGFCGGCDPDPASSGGTIKGSIRTGMKNALT